MIIIENIFENTMNEPDCRDSPLSKIYENRDVPNVNPLEVNHPNPNFIVLSDSYRYGEVSIESSNAIIHNT